MTIKVQAAHRGRTTHATHTSNAHTVWHVQGTKTHTVWHVQGTKTPTILLTTWFRARPFLDQTLADETTRLVPLDHYSEGSGHEKSACKIVAFWARALQRSLRTPHTFEY